MISCSREKRSREGRGLQIHKDKDSRKQSKQKGSYKIIEEGVAEVEAFKGESGNYRIIG